MRADEQTSSWNKDGHVVFIGPVQTEVRNGKRRHYREISLDGRVIGRSQGKSLLNARYRSAEEVEIALRIAQAREQSK